MGGRERGSLDGCLSEYISFHPPPLCGLKSLKPTRIKGDEEDEEEIPNQNPEGAFYLGFVLEGYTIENGFVQVAAT